MLNTLVRLNQALEDRTQKDILRRLKPPDKGIDFYSNDYLGFTQNVLLQEMLLKEINKQPYLLKGATGSRLISGNTDFMMEAEAFLV